MMSDDVIEDSASEVDRLIFRDRLGSSHAPSITWRQGLAGNFRESASRLSDTTNHDAKLPTWRIASIFWSGIGMVPVRPLTRSDCVRSFRQLIRRNVPVQFFPGVTGSRNADRVTLVRQNKIRVFTRVGHQ